MPTEASNILTVLENIKEISARFAQERSERQRRRELVKTDFDLLRDAGFLLTAVPVDRGGMWEDVHRTVPRICEMLRTLAHGDSSVALVASMHPSVLMAGTWLTADEAPPPFRQAWEEQQHEVFQTVCEGHWWGTIMSEGGTGGDLLNTKMVAISGPSEGKYSLTGQKQFGSGSGNASFMITTAVAEGETEPDVFFMDMRGAPWDGSAGVALTAPWDGHGMTATQSHAMHFDGYPATRQAWPRPMAERLSVLHGAVQCMFTSVIVGVAEAAVETARQQLQGKRDSMRAYEQTEWSRVEIESWLIQQAYEGMLRALAEKRNGHRNALLGKTAIAELTESALLRICKVIGGGSYSRHSPLGFWLEDVRALGFLRPPWGFAFDGIFQGTWNTGN